MVKKGFFVLLITVSSTIFSSSIFARDEPLGRVEPPRLTVVNEWCEKIGMRPVMLDMKLQLQLLTSALSYRDWDETDRIAKDIKAMYDGLNLAETEVPEDFWEFNDDFQRYYKRFFDAVEKKDGDDADYQFGRLKTACHHCHIRLVRRIKPDKDVGLERMYKDQFKVWGDGRSYPATKKEHPGGSKAYD